MIKTLYAVFDSKSASFCNPFVQTNDQCAMRDFRHAASDSNLDIGRYPTDYTLFKLATFNFNTGEIKSESTPVSLGLASSLINFEG